MCWSCARGSLSEVGTVTITGDHVALGPLIRQLYDTPWGGVGGPLHVVLDDSNTEDRFLLPEHVRESVWHWLPWCEVAFTEADYELVQDIAARLLDLPTEADRDLAIQLAHDGSWAAVGTMFMVDNRWPDEVVVGTVWPRP